MTQFINDMSKTHKFDKKYLTEKFKQIESSPDVIKKISTPFEAMPWDKYRKHFLIQKRIDGGVVFWNKYERSLAKAEKTYGVPASLIVAIIGIESFYGKIKGNYPVLQSLSTLAFDYKPRAKFFKKELEEYLLLTKEHNFDPLSLKGSYAGAMGAPQFISSSYRNYAVDFEKSGSVDLINNLDHAVSSVGNYFKSHGWQKGQAVIHKPKITGKAYEKLVKTDKSSPKPKFNLKKLQPYGIKSTDKLKKDTSLSFLEFEGKKKEHWLGRNNFYVITRYNHSNNYALAVYELSQAIEKAHSEKKKS